MGTGVQPKLFTEGMCPDHLHGVPVGDNAMLDRMVDIEKASLGDGGVTNARGLGLDTLHRTEAI